jgi:hypothetical protein
MLFRKAPSATGCSRFSARGSGMQGRSEEEDILCARPSSILRARPPHCPREPLHEERAFASPYSLARAFQKLNKQPTDLLRLLLLKPVSRAINKMSTAHLRAGGALHPLERAGNLENTPVALSAYE